MKYCRTCEKPFHVEESKGLPSEDYCRDCRDKDADRLMRSPFQENALLRNKKSFAERTRARNSSTLPSINRPNKIAAPVDQNQDATINTQKKKSTFKDNLENIGPVLAPEVGNAAEYGLTTASGLIPTPVAPAGAMISLAIHGRAIHKTDGHVSALVSKYQAAYGETPETYQNEDIEDVKTAVRYAIRKKDLKSIHRAGEASAALSSSTIGAGVGAGLGSVAGGVGAVPGAIFGWALGSALGLSGPLAVRKHHKKQKEKDGTLHVHRRDAARVLWTTACAAREAWGRIPDQTMANLACVEILGEENYQAAISALEQGDSTKGEDLIYDKLKSW